MSKYLLDKFLYTVDRDPELVERYREDPRGFVEWWEAERANVILNVLTGEKSSWLSFDDVIPGVAQIAGGPVDQAADAGMDRISVTVARDCYADGFG